MARNYVQKVKTITVVHGYVLRDGAPEAAAFTIEKRIGINAAQAIVRKDEPSFMAASVEEQRTLYTMTFDRFYELADARPLEDGEEADESED